MTDGAMITAIILLIAGGIFVFFGKKITPIFIFITGGLIGITISSTIISLIESSQGIDIHQLLQKHVSKEIVDIVFSVGPFIIFGVLSLIFMKLFIVLAGAYWGFVLFNMLAYVFDVKNTELILIISFVGAILGLIIAFKLKEFLFIVASSFAGAILMTFGIDFFRGIERFSIPVKSFESIDKVKEMIQSDVPSTFFNQFIKAFDNIDIVSIILIAIITVVGILFQTDFALIKKISGKNGK